MRSLSLTLLLLLFAATAQAQAIRLRLGAPQDTTVGIGDPAPDFKLPGVDGKDYTLQSFADAKLLLVIFTCNHCPTAQAYEQRIIDLQKDYKEKGVALLAISPNDPKSVRLDELGYTNLSDSFDEMKLRAKERDYKFPYLYDGETQQTSKAFGVLATPHAFLFDQERKLRYCGAIDDSDIKVVGSRYLRDAIDALLDGKPVPADKTRVFGCSTKWADKQNEAEKSLEAWDKEEVKLSELDEASLAKLAKNDTDKLLLVNVWATWCAPCVKELPELVTTNRMYRKRNFQMVTISLDEPGEKDAALKMLQEKHVSSTNYLAAIDKKDKIAELLDKEWPGPVPYTLLIAPGGKVIYRRSNQIDPLELRTAIVDYLGRTYAGRIGK